MKLALFTPLIGTSYVEDEPAIALHTKLGVRADVLHFDIQSTKRTKMLRAIIVATVVLIGSAASVQAQDAPTANPKTIHVTLDNAHVRVFEATLKPGVKENPHSHPTTIVYVIAGGTARNHLPDGSASVVKYTAGQTFYRDPIAQHWAENIGKTTIRLIVVEMKPEI